VFTSGRISRDYLQKVIKAGFRIVVSRAAVTASAVALARAENITMLGFIRRNGGNIYHVGEVTIF
jgi:FdhD protein